MYANPTYTRGSESPYTWKAYNQKGKIMSLCDPELRNGVGA